MPSSSICKIKGLTFDDRYVSFEREAGICMNKEELNKVLELHKAYLNEEPNGVKADLCKADLRRADLRRADLRKANLHGADLRRANLRMVDLRRANLRGADLREADLWWADLRGANLHRANLRVADLREANLREANLREADLHGADLRDTGILTFQFNQHWAIYNGETLNIGCHTKSLAEWLDVYQSVGKDEEYSDIEIEMYGDFIKMCVKVQGKPS